MVCSKMRKAWYGTVAVYGLVAAVAPRVSTKLSLKKWLFGFENADALEPTDWYVRAVRATGVGMLAAGGTGLLLESRAAAADESESALPDESDAEPDV